MIAAALVGRGRQGAMVEIVQAGDGHGTLCNVGGARDWEECNDWQWGGAVCGLADGCGVRTFQGPHYVSRPDLT